MRLTCLKCGHQVEMETTPGAVSSSCICGQDYVYPQVVDTGVRPNQRAAERSRFRAFRAAGLVKNVGGFALAISLFSIVFFPLAVFGAALGVYVLTMVRGPLGRYSGRASAVWAIVVGVAVFAGEGLWTLSLLRQRALDDLSEAQETGAADLRDLVRAERLYHARTDAYGLFHSFAFQPRFGEYTIYLTPDDFAPAIRDRQQVVDALPKGFLPAVSRDDFTAVAVANLDDDAALDVWTVTSAGNVLHVQNDANNQ